VIGNGVAVDPLKFLEEVRWLRSAASRSTAATCASQRTRT
jgi:adenylosuccinate synthase